MGEGGQKLIFIEGVGGEVWVELLIKINGDHLFHKIKKTGSFANASFLP